MSWTMNVGGDSEYMRAALLVSVLGSCYVLYKALDAYLAKPSTVHILRGPESSSWRLGNVPDIRAPYKNPRFQSWIETYGLTFTTYGLFGVKDLVTADPKAMSFILSHSSEFTRPQNLSNGIRFFIGNGLLAADGLEHRKQRKVLNPAFSLTAMRDISPILMQVSQKLGEVWKRELSRSNARSAVQDSDINDWTSKAALDIIGLAGFGYKFNTLEDPSNELALAFSELVNGLTAFSFRDMITNFIPAWRSLPTPRNMAIRQSAAIRRRVGVEIIADKKAEVKLLGEDDLLQAKDLLSVLIRANIKENDAERLDDETLLAETSTFIVAGHETVATALSWGLLALARAPSVQSRLRDELFAFPSDSPTMDELNAMPYLDNVVKEILRLTPPIPTTRRTANVDAVIPLAFPVIGKDGKEIFELFVRRGDTISLHNYASNTRKDLWGDDALEFRPERFDKLPEAVSEVPSLFAHLSTFVTGARGCIGWRMAVLEMQTLLFTLIRTFQFDIVPGIEIVPRIGIALKPQVKGQEARGQQLPLRVSLYGA
ncbi:hypothetical protein FRB96_005301 [Tulasnella sp. 330]|nr:hypothetical protein FRB96_005301 [Tulasnella sp. 330]KAG8871382.1 hypothetical protein FRB98_000822 [Tulasnella sp. 332]